MALLQLGYMDCFFINLVVQEWYYRDKSSNEIDMVIENDGLLHPLEIKRSVNPGSELIGAFEVLDKGSVPRGKGAILCMRPELSAINADNFIVPIWII